MKKALLAALTILSVTENVFSQVDSSYIYNTNTPYGTLDVRIAKSETRYYFLEEDVTFSFRESSPGVKTNTFRDMTSWDSSPYGEGNLREQVDGVSNFVMNYRLLKPQNYDASFSDGYPLLVMFHGSGETGNCWNVNCFHADANYNPLVNDPPAPTDSDHELLNNDHNLLHGGKVYLDAVNRSEGKLPNDASLAARAFPGFVLFPQNLNGWSGGTVQDAIRIIRLLSKKYNIDEDRIYIHGLSNGGYGVYEALKRTPWLFASAIVMSAVSDGFITNTNMESAISDIKLWIFQGALDTNPYPQKTRRYIQEFRVAGAQVRYTEYADVGHTVWNRAYQEADFFSWFLEQNKSAVHVYGGEPVICSEQGLKLEMPEGFMSYQWEKDGVVVSGADSATFVATQPGNYRGRFSRLSQSPTEEEWNEWSPVVSVTVQDPPAAHVNQVGTVLMRDLNNANVVKLESADEHAHYYWYKDGTLLDLPGAEDDTLKSIEIQSGNCSGACTGNGAYTLVTATYGNCKSDPSQPKYVFFNNQAPMNLSAATDFSGNASASSVILTWTDNESDELGYEVWRRTQAGDTFTSWEMLSLTNADAQELEDVNVLPETTYQYKIRAVGAGARSEYTPAGTGTLEINTVQDTEAPGAPDQLTATRLGVENFRLNWTAASDNSAIQKYKISYEGGVLETSNEDTVYVVDGLQVDSIYHFTVSAIDFGGNESGPSPVATIVTSVNGLLYQHSTGTWSTLDSIDWSVAEYTGEVSNITLSPKTQDDYFNFQFDGFLNVLAEGDYNFRVGSNDGSRLFIDKNLVVDNDGIHDLTVMESGTITLSAAPHRLTLQFFDYVSEDTLVVEYNGPDTGGEWKVIPDEALKSNIVIAAEPSVNGEFAMDVFPNPSPASALRIILKSKQSLPVQIIVFNSIGRAITSQLVLPGDLKDQNDLQLEKIKDLTQGIYFIKAIQGGRSIVRKTIITHP